MQNGLPSFHYDKTGKRLTYSNFCGRKLAVFYYFSEILDKYGLETGSLFLSTPLEKQVKPEEKPYDLYRHSSTTQTPKPFNFSNE